jgi:hypothetical protein
MIIMNSGGYKRSREGTAIIVDGILPEGGRCYATGP